MQAVSDLFRSILDTTHRCETRVRIDGVWYDNRDIISCKTSLKLFSKGQPQIGQAICGELDLVLRYPGFEFSRMAEIRLEVRVTDGVRYSEWIPKGIYFIDTRDTSSGTTYRETTIHAYDAMLKTEQNALTTSDGAWNKNDIAAVRFIASSIGITVDPRTEAIMTNNITVPDPGTGDSAYTRRELLQLISAWYGGSFIISDSGKLRLVRLADVPVERNVLVTKGGDPITFGGVSIRV